MIDKNDQTEELPEIGKVRRLVLQPDEWLIVSYPSRISPDALDRIKQGFTDRLGVDPARLVVLDSDPTLTAFKVAPGQ